VLGPFGDALKRSGLKTAGAPLGFASARDESGALENFQVFGDGRQAHLKRFGEFGDAGAARGEAGEDRATGGVGEGGESGAKAVRGHLYLTYRLNTTKEEFVSREIEPRWNLAIQV